MLVSIGRSGLRLDLAASNREAGWKELPCAISSLCTFRRPKDRKVKRYEFCYVAGESQEYSKIDLQRSVNYGTAIWLPWNAIFPMEYALKAADSSEQEWYPLLYIENNY